MNSIKSNSENSENSEKSSEISSVQTNHEEANECAAIQSPNEPHLPCLMSCKPGHKYCSMHLLQNNLIDYSQKDNDILMCSETIRPVPKNITNPILKREVILDRKNIINDQPINPSNNSDTVFKEQKISTIVNNHKENEDDLEIKLLILVNDDEYSEKIPELIGPIFHDITLSDDEQDPITLDPIWKYVDGVKVPALVNKYYLFSYIDSKGKIRCFTIFVLYDMFMNNELVHPITMEPIPERDIVRAKELIDIYSKKIDLFKQIDESTISPEFKLKNRLTRLFQKFHLHSIYFEESWLLSITNPKDLYKIITETEKLVTNNIPSINGNLHSLNLFQQKPQKKISKIPVMVDDDPIILKEYIIGEWEKLIEAADKPQNQIPIWILASGISFVVPEIKQKYPDLEIML